MNTLRMGIKYPSENQRDWWDIFVAMMNDFDASLYAGREDRNIIMMGGGTVSWDKNTSELSWTSDILFVSPHKGYVEKVLTGNITVGETEFFYVNLTRLPGANVTLSPYYSSKVPESDNAYAVAFRYNDTIYFRNGRSLEHGESGPLFVETVPGSGIYDWIRKDIIIQSDGDTWLGYGETETDSIQGNLSTAFPEPLLGSDSVDVYKDGVLCKYVSGAPSNSTEWTWVDSGSPEPVIQIGAGSLTNDVYTVNYPRGLSGSISNWLRTHITVQTNGDTWVGNGSTETSTTQGGLTTAFPIPLVNFQSVDVFYNGVLMKQITGSPSDTTEYRWVTNGSPEPVIEIGAGSVSGDLITVRTPYV